MLEQLADVAVEELLKRDLAISVRIQISDEREHLIFGTVEHHARVVSNLAAERNQRPGPVSNRNRAVPCAIVKSICCTGVRQMEPRRNLSALASRLCAVHLVVAGIWRHSNF